MSAQPQRSGFGPRLAAWLGSAPTETTPAPLGAADAARWAVWADIEAFLMRHRIDPSPANYEIAHAYMMGDPMVREPIETALRTDGRVGLATFDAIADARDRNPTGPDFLARVTEQLEHRLGEALTIASHSADTARDYGAALDHEARNASDDPAGALERLVAMTRDVVDATKAMESQFDEMRRETDRLKGDLDHARKAAERDHLTGLPNRRFFDVKLADAGTDACVALCDIDNFKLVNDRHGHETGDRVLRFFAKTLKQELRGKALVARYGGEEFACLFSGKDPAAARAALDSCRQRLQARGLIDRTSDERIGLLTFSAGLALIGANPREALRAADTALYRAKRLGKDRVELAGPAAQG